MYYDVQLPRVPVPVPSVPNDIATAGIEKSEYLQIQTILLTKYTETIVTSPHYRSKTRRSHHRRAICRSVRYRFEPHYATRSRRAHERFVAVRLIALLSRLRRNGYRLQILTTTEIRAGWCDDVADRLKLRPHPLAGARSTTAPPNCPNP